ncbi:hypothetical protein CsSME_00028820 [Camellia sinensis var. sinensis]
MGLYELRNLRIRISKSHTHSKSRSVFHRASISIHSYQREPSFLNPPKYTILPLSLVSLSSVHATNRSIKAAKSRPRGGIDGYYGLGFERDDTMGVDAAVD